MNKGFVRTEIGGEFWDIPLSATETKLLPPGTMWFISGTAALEYIIRDMQAGTVLKTVGVPSWCCSCMIQPFLNAGLQVVFYPVYVDGGALTCDYRPVSSCDAVLVLSYFGYVRLKTVGHPGGILIRDLTHSLFCDSREEAQYYFGSLRKWAGFWTGGYGWKQTSWQNTQPVPLAEPSYLQQRCNAMSMKLDYLRGATDQKDYLVRFEEAEDFLDYCGILGSCERDIHCARHLDGAYIKARRRENVRILLEAVKDIALFPEMQEDDCPMFVPILLPDRASRDKLRRYLISQEIYCPVHWPVSGIHVLGPKESALCERSMSLVCDQRYGPEDMARIVDVLRKYRK